MIKWIIGVILFIAGIVVFAIEADKSESFTTTQKVGGGLIFGAVFWVLKIGNAVLEVVDLILKLFYNIYYGNWKDV